jgi:hypothetical protein
MGTITKFAADSPLEGHGFRTSGSAQKMGGSDITSAHVPRQAGADQTGAFFPVSRSASRVSQ